MADGRDEDRHDDDRQDGDREIAGQRADPVAAQNEDIAQAGGPLSGEPARGGDAYASGGPKGKGAVEESGSRTAGSDAPIASDVAPRVHTAMDGDVRATERKARETASP